MRALALAVPFVAGIAAPAIHRATASAPEGVRAEFRPLAPRPELGSNAEDLRAFPAAFDAWYADHFGLRVELIRAHNRLKLLGLGSSPTRRLVVGPGAWVFAAWDDTVAFSMGLHPLAGWELDAWESMLAVRRDALDKRGIAYRFTLVPGKDRFYGDRLPARLQRTEEQRRAQPTRREQFLERLDGEPHVVDLWPAYERALELDDPDADQALFFRLGDHWNDQGAIVGARAIVASLAAEIPELAEFEGLDEERFQLQPATGSGDSWAGRLYLEDELTQDVWFLAGTGRRDGGQASERSGVRMRRFGGPDRPAGEGGRAPVKALVFHDSFGAQILPFLALAFDELVGCWRGDYDAAVVDEEAPDVVIELYVERVLATRAARLMGKEAEGLLRQRFATLEPLLDASRPGDRVEAFALQGTPTLEAGAGGELVVTTDSRGDLLELPEVDWPDGACVLRIVVEPPEATLLQLAYLTQGDETYDLSRSLNLALEAGRNELFVDLSIPGLMGRLLMRPGLARGRYVVHELEVRGEPPR